MSSNNGIPFAANTFVPGYTRFLHDSWYSYNYNPYGFFNETPGLFALSNYALSMSISTIAMTLISQLEGGMIIHPNPQQPSNSHCCCRGNSGSGG